MLHFPFIALTVQPLLQLQGPECRNCEAGVHPPYFTHHVNLSSDYWIQHIM